MSQNKKALIILGMHRSGTSVVTGLCGMLGIELGEHLMGAEIGNNEKGFFEHSEIVEIHQEILAKFGHNWDDTRPLPNNWWQDKRVEFARHEIIKIINRDFINHKIWAIKDPRMCLMLPMWLNILKELSITPIFLNVLRNPLNVASSLEKRDGFGLKKSLLLWIMHNLEAEKYSRSYKRSFINFDDLVGDWQKTSNKIASDLDIKWPNDINKNSLKDEINNFIELKLIHHKNSAKIKSDSAEINKWVDELNKNLNGFCKKDVASQHKKLDKIYEEFKNTLNSSVNMLSFWIDETLDKRIELTQTYTKLHEANVTSIKHVQTIAKREKRIGTLISDVANREADIGKLNGEIEGLKGNVAKLKDHIEVLLNSTSWKVTKPIRAVKRLLPIAKTLLYSKTYKNLYAIYKNEGVKGIIRKIEFIISPEKYNKVAEEEQDNIYQQWIERYDCLNEEDISAIKNHIKKFKSNPLISVIMPVYNVEGKWLIEAIDSVRNQLYENWELCIADDCSPSPHIRQILDKYVAQDARIKVVYRQENGHISACSNSAIKLAKGDFIALMDHDDRLAKTAFYYVANEINEHPKADIIYSDEDKIDESGHRYSPHFKTQWNADLFYSQNIINHLGVYRASLINEIKGFRIGLEGSQDYDLILRILKKTSADKIRHIPHILYHWRAIEGSTAISVDNKSYTVDAARTALKDYFEDENIVIKGGKNSDYHRIIWPVPSAQPKVTLIMPTRNAVTLVRQAIDSILEKTEYENYEIVIVNNQSDDRETLRYFESLKNHKKVHVIDYDEPFNFSAINNFAVQQTRGELLGFINNDIEVISPNWLTEMVSHAIRNEVGMVGAKLYYPDDNIQHAGVLLGAGAPIDAVAGHYFHHHNREDEGYFARANLVQSMSAVTGACMVLRRSIFKQVGGFNEEDLSVAFNDIDLCLKISAAGYNIVWSPYAELYHHESATRGAEDTAEKQQRFRKEIQYMRDNWADILDNDPYYNPNLDVIRGNFLPAFPPRSKKPWKNLP